MNPIYEKIYGFTSQGKGTQYFLYSATRPTMYQKITIQTPLDSQEGWSNAAKLCALALAAMGASKSEFDVLFDKRLASRHSSDVGALLLIVESSCKRIH